MDRGNYYFKTEAYFKLNFNVRDRGKMINAMVLEL
jgi:hypothetical protein